MTVPRDDATDVTSDLSWYYMAFTYVLVRGHNVSLTRVNSGARAATTQLVSLVTWEPYFYQLFRTCSCSPLPLVVCQLFLKYFRVLLSWSRPQDERLASLDDTTFAFSQLILFILYTLSYSCSYSTYLIVFHYKTNFRSNFLVWLCVIRHSYHLSANPTFASAAVCLQIAQ